VPGLSTLQSLLFFEALAHHWLAVCTVALALLPIPFLYTGYSPVVAPAMWEFTLVSCQSTDQYVNTSSY
jgi:hypothetical protein